MGIQKPYPQQVLHLLGWGELITLWCGDTALYLWSMEITWGKEKANENVGGERRTCQLPLVWLFFVLKLPVCFFWGTKWCDFCNSLKVWCNCDVEGASCGVLKGFEQLAVTSCGSQGLPGFVGISQQWSQISGRRLSYKPSALAYNMWTHNLSC